jgi:TetR/AcrR family transcriptional regulator, mexJK operon transcriptional repressor
MTAGTRALNREARHQAILDAALQIFASQGFSGTKMDQIAEAAGISKPTLYQYFPTKDGLFNAMMHRARDRMLAPFAGPSDDDMVPALWRFSWAYADLVLSPAFLALARLVIAEAARFPEIGRAYQAAGPDRVLAGMIDWLSGRRDAGRLRFDNADLAAEHLWALILSGLRNRALHVPDALPDHSEVHRHLSQGLSVFLRAYSAHAGPDLETLSHLINKETAA